MTMRYRINNRIRFTLFVVLAIILLTTCVNFALGLNVASSSTIPQYAQVEIESGDTLWEIAELYMDDSDDIRKFVYDICKLNDITAAELQAGMTIMVPIN